MKKQLILENEALKSKLAHIEEELNLLHKEIPYKLLIEEMKEGAVTISEEGVILFCNHSFADLVAMPMEEIIGTPFIHFLNKTERHVYDDIFYENIPARISEEIVYCTCNETRKYLRLSYCPIPRGVMGKFSIIISDVSELKKYQNELQLLVEERTHELEYTVRQLNETNATKDKLFSIIAHDLRAPFTALLGFSELLTSNARNYEPGHYNIIVSNIQSAAKSAFELLENLLQWAIAQKKQLHFTPELVNLTLILIEVTESVRTLATMKNITVNYIHKEKIMIHVDVNMLKTILRNLLTNAIKFSYPGGKIDVMTIVNPDDIEISVKDFGVGMSKEKIKILFNIEAEKTSRGTADEKGTGLGLLICKEFIEMHNGHLHIESKLGKGSSFTVIIPQKELAYNDAKPNQF